MTAEDAELYKVDPDFAISLGVEPPKCQRCGTVFRSVPHDWDGSSEIVHMVPALCMDLRDQPVEDALG